MSEVEVAVVAEEMEAEIIRSRLEAESIPARVAFRSQFGVPRAWSPAGLGFGPGSYAVRVPREYEREARDVLGTAEPARPRSRGAPTVVVKVVAAVILAWWLLAIATSIGQIPDLLR